MKFITRQSLANEAAKRWKIQYEKWTDEKKIAIGENLERLGKTPKPDDIDNIIGNTTWTRVRPCDECEKDAPLVVQLGQEPDYESATAFICLGCIREALSVAPKPEDV